MIWKTPCPAEEGGAYPCCLGVKAGLHSEAYWLRLGPVWTNKAAVWSHLTTAPEAYQETFFFPASFFKRLLQPLPPKHRPLALCFVFVCLIGLAFGRWRETGTQKKSLSGSKSLAFVSTPSRVPFVGLCKHLFRPNCTWLTLASGYPAPAEN